MDKQNRELAFISILGVVMIVILIITFRISDKRVYEIEKPLVETEYIPYIANFNFMVIDDESEVEIEEAELVKLDKVGYYNPTDEEIELMARVVMSEASILPIEGKQAVAQTIINRMYSSKFPNNIEAVINAANQYSTADNGVPDSECYEAVKAACNYLAFPTDMFYFRTGHYHEWAEDYIQIGNTYFSTEVER